MKLYGWCEKCHRVRRVRVRVPKSGGLQVGVCDECEEKRR